MWFIFALASTLSWGVADLFYKKGADESSRYSHLKTSVAVGAAMGIYALFTLIITGMDYNPINLLIYLPVSLCYVLSMVVGYYGLRYLMLSVSSPVQNSSGALCCIMCLVILGQTMDALSAVGVVAVCIGVLALGILEKKQWDKENEKPKIGFLAFMMPIIYCVIDALGTFLDTWYLDDVSTSPLVGITEETLENTANVSYQLTFFIIAVALTVFLIIKGEGKRLIGANVSAAAVFETAGQATYVFALSGNGVVAAPMIASYSIVSLLLSRVFLKEKLTAKQYASIAVVMAGILLLGIAEGLAE